MSSLCKGYEEKYSRANEERVTGNVNLNRDMKVLKYTQFNLADMKTILSDDKHR